MSKICGIYKITSPSGKIYIGSSVDIGFRKYKYKKLHCKKQPKLYNSFMKYSFDNHIFEIIMECKNEDLFHFERCFQEIYNSVECGLNCVYVNTDEKYKIVSEETKKKISLVNTGRKLTEAQIEKIKINSTGRCHSEESKQLMREVQRKFNINGVSVLQYSLDGVFLKEFPNIRTACREVGNNICRRHIKKCCNGKTLSVKGFMWRFKTENYHLTITPYKTLYNEYCNVRKIIQYDKNLNLINTYMSTLEACTVNNFNKSGLKACLSGRNATYKDSIWKYA
jgi:group I intron endonuclease